MRQTIQPNHHCLLLEEPHLPFILQSRAWLCARQVLDSLLPPTTDLSDLPSSPEHCSSLSRATLDLVTQLFPENVLEFIPPHIFAPHPPSTAFSDAPCSWNSHPDAPPVHGIGYARSFSIGLIPSHRDSKCTPSRRQRPRFAIPSLGPSSATVAPTSATVLPAPHNPTSPPFFGASVAHCGY